MCKNVEKEDVCSKELSGRCRVFLETWIVEGYQEAKERSGYSSMQISRIIHDPRSKEYMSNKFKEIAEKKGWSYERELEELKAMIKDPRIPGSSRIAAQERFCDRFKDDPDISLSNLKIASYEVHSLEKPKEKGRLEAHEGVSEGEDVEES